MSFCITIISALLYYLFFIIKEDEVGGKCGTHGGGERCLQGFFGMPESKRSLGRPSHRCEDNIKMDLREIRIDRRTGFS
jgi:hypothetical protein